MILVTEMFLALSVAILLFPSGVHIIPVQGTLGAGHSASGSQILRFCVSTPGESRSG